LIDPIVEAHRQKREHIRQLVEETTRGLVDRGRLIEAGWQTLRIMAISADASDLQLEEMRNAFFAGAHHLLGAVMTFLDDGEEPTDEDVRRMGMIHAELEQFIKIFEQRHRLGGTA
jgi:hypothetical protein